MWVIHTEQVHGRELSVLWKEGRDKHGHEMLIISHAHHWKIREANLTGVWQDPLYIYLLRIDCFPKLSPRLLEKQKVDGREHICAERSVAQDSPSAAKKSGLSCYIPSPSVVLTSSMQLQDLHSVARNIIWLNELLLLVVSWHTTAM